MKKVQKDVIINLMEGAKANLQQAEQRLREARAVASNAKDEGSTDARYVQYDLEDRLYQVGRITSDLGANIDEFPTFDD